MSYNAITMAAQTPTAMTSSDLQAAIAANTTAMSQLATTVERSHEQLNQALNFLLSEFIRSNAQQHLQSIERLERMEGIVEAIAQQQQTSAQQIASNVEAVTQLDGRLEETRQLVAKNASDIAQLGVKVDSNADQVAALAETSRTQLAAIISNGRRLDRLEQQAS